MKYPNVEKADIATLVSAYRSSAADHGAATENGDYPQANRHHDMIAKIYRELRRRGDEVRSALLPLLDDFNPHVRAWAASHALEFAPERGERVLQRLAGVAGVVGLNAETTLREWKNGSLHFP